MVTVALIGADGAGKTSVARRLEEGTAIRFKYIYMGVNPDASNYALPTTRLVQRARKWLGLETHAGGPPDPGRRKRAGGGLLRRGWRGIRSGFRLANQLGEEWFRQCVAWYYQWRGFVVLFDRHFYPDYFAHDISGDPGDRRLSRRIHGLLLNKLYPRPDMVILLDAPAQVLFDRKREGSVELIERRRQEYFRLRGRIPNFAVVRVDRPMDEVVREVLEIVGDFRDGRKAK